MQTNGAGEIAVNCRPRHKSPPETSFSGEITACGTMNGKRWDGDGSSIRALIGLPGGFLPFSDLYSV